jgi:hypothetical protein
MAKVKWIFRDDKGRFVRKPMPAEAATDVSISEVEREASNRRITWRETWEWIGIFAFAASLGFLIGWFLVCCLELFLRIPVR